MRRGGAAPARSTTAPRAVAKGEDHRRARLARRRQVQVRLCALAVMPPQVDRQYTRLWAVLKSGR
ncbi:hypothetical protein XthCFBP4691_14180 [Xanthomonas theicola]|uniref:Uncharacterized protein n=1 Tax=Xanthomonas theicola TaxID=56464 RepID=A0A2S6ZCY7_9XANT|nr:hypothetical protein XthCFBP4691_14180 [Xanthomonas theicola]